jgi:hypothetical protein
MDGWLEIFKTGRHTDMGGQTREFTEADLQAIAAGYDPAKHEAPLTKGHPAHDAPAYGWAEALKAEAGKLFAKPKQVAQELVDAVRAGQYRHLSAAFYLPDSPNNPTPGQLALRHIGFLGAMPPAVKGLAPVTFGDGERWIGFLEDYQPACAAGAAGREAGIRRLLRNVREWLIGTAGQEAADRVIPQYELDSLEPPAEPLAPAATWAEGTKGVDAMTMKEMLGKLREGMAALFGDMEKAMGEGEAAHAQRQAAPGPGTFSGADVTAREQAAVAKALEAERARTAAAQRVAEAKARVAAFVEAGVKGGTFLPAWREAGVPAVLEQALLVETPLTFAEGQPPKNPGEILLGFFEGLPQVVTFGEVAPASKAAPAGDTAGAKLETLTGQYLKDHKEATYSLAFAEVQRANPDLATAYATELAPKR